MDFYFKWVVILSLGILVFVFFAFFAKKFKEAALNLEIGGNKLSVKTSQLQVSSEKIVRYDPQTHYIDSQRGFLFKIPSEEKWNKPEFHRGIDAVLNAKSITLTPGSQEQIIMGLALSPLAPMLSEVEMLRVASRESINIEVTDETTNDLINAAAEKILGEEQEEGDEISADDISSTRRMLIGFEQLIWSNDFTVSIFDKSKLKNLPVKISLPSFGINFISSQGLSIDHLVADEQSILTGACFSFECVKIDEHITDLRIDRWTIVTETKRAFFVIEIAYSPQTADSMRMWEQLRSTMDSFRTIES